MLALIVATALAGDVQHDLERAFTMLRDNASHARVRSVLGKAVRHLDDLDPARSDLSRALAGDKNAPFRGQAHERTIALLTLAALDVEAGHCDTAIPATKNAEHHHMNALLAAGVHSDQAAAALPLAELLRAQCDDGRATEKRLVFRGKNPTLTAHGSYDEYVMRSASDNDDVAFVITLPGKKKRAKEATPRMLWDTAKHAPPLGVASAARRAERANERRTLTNKAHTTAAKAPASPTTARQALGSALLWTSAFGQAATAATIDARADTRTVMSMPARIVLE